jgi:RNA polymerase sigma-70 factor (ECF subfamily)
MEIDVEKYYRVYGPMVLRRCRFLLREEESALDAMQEVFVRLIKNRERLTGRYPSSLLYRMATNVCLNIIRERKRRPVTPVDEALALISALDVTEKRFWVIDLLDKLFEKEPPSTREIAVMRYIDQLTHEEVAEATGMSVSGVRKRLRSLRKRALRLKEITDEI